MAAATQNTRTDLESGPQGAAPARLRQEREAAERRFSELSAPDRIGMRDENYRYTSLKDIEFDRRPSAARSVQGERLNSDSPVRTADSSEACLLLERATGAAPEVVFRGEAAGKVYVASIEVALAERPEILSRLGADAAFPKVFEGDVFANLVAARAASGVVVYVPRGARVEGVLRTLHFFDAEASTALNRVILIADEGAEVTYVDEFRGEGLLNGKAPLCAALVQVHAAAGARVRYAQVQDWGSNVQGFLRQNFVAERDAEISVVSVASGGRKVQSRSEMECVGRGSRVTFQGAARGDDSQHFDYWVTARHTVPDTSSDMRHLTVMADSARSVFNGSILITREGVRTDANQQNRNMVLSKKAVADAFPKLEIATDDVKCAHGAAIVPIDPAQLYYLRSRGIDRREAELMIINGFTESVVDALPTEELKDRVHATFARKHALDGLTEADVRRVAGAGAAEEENS